MLKKNKKILSLLLFDQPAPSSPLPGPKKLDLTRENLNALLGPSSFKPNSQTPSTFTRGSGQTGGGRGPGTTRGWVRGGYDVRQEEGWVFLHIALENWYYQSETFGRYMIDIERRD